MGVTAVIIAAAARAEVTLDECQRSAHDNYPVTKQYDLLKITEDINLDDINKIWLPGIGVYAQGTGQNVVPSFPTSLTNMMEQMGNEMKGLGKIQYKVGLELNQIIWDGGATRSQRERVRSQAEVDRASVDVELYGLRGRVESLYFGILLLESQIEQTRSAMEVYKSNLERLRSMVSNGAAMSADADMVEAQLLTLSQQLSSALSAAKGYRASLSLLTGLDLKNEKMVMPAAEMPASSKSLRPELNLFAAREALNESRKSGIEALTMPTIGFFAQTYYGYPGIDYFKAMTERSPSFNFLAGVRVSWNIDSFYTRKNSLKRIDAASQMLESQLATFMLNNRIQTDSQIEEIRGLEEVMAEDARIVELRSNVRRAAESQLRNGIIDATALMVKINDETQATLASAYHKIRYIQAIYNLKNTINR